MGRDLVIIPPEPSPVTQGRAVTAFSPSAGVRDSGNGKTAVRRPEPDWEWSHAVALDDMPAGEPVVRCADGVYRPRRQAAAHDCLWPLIAALRIRPHTLRHSADGTWEIVGPRGVIRAAHGDYGWHIRFDRWMPCAGRRDNHRDAACEAIWKLSRVIGDAAGSATWLHLVALPGRDGCVALRKALGLSGTS